MVGQNRLHALTNATDMIRYQNSLMSGQRESRSGPGIRPHVRAGIKVIRLCRTRSRPLPQPPPLKVRRLLGV